jgi:Icc-related predicted phosphoesterase
MNNLYSKVFSQLQYVSDLHLEKGFRRYIKPIKPYLLLGGDIGYPSEKNYKDFLFDMSYSFDKVFVISGNHEYDNTKNITNVESNIINISQMRKNIFYLQKSEHVFSEKENISLLGCTLWSSLPKSKYEYHKDHVEWLKNTINQNPNKNYVIATHHCPLYECLNIKYHSKTPNYFASNQTNIIEKNNVLSWIHGHSHCNKDINICGKWIVSNQYGSYKNPLKSYK